jgi:hypothetical protein
MTVGASPPKVSSNPILYFRLVFQHNFHTSFFGQSSIVLVVTFSLLRRLAMPFQLCLFGFLFHLKCIGGLLFLNGGKVGRAQFMFGLVQGSL